jgi:ectoine hydroxylase-related dioxygenase (phytanoyl-CoA dioxygenase family)
MYWKVCSSEQMITAWIPFHDADEQIGTITMIDGSNLWPDNTGELNFFSSDLDGLEKKFNTDGEPVKKVPMLLKKGQVSFHNCLTIHGSGPNLTDQPRRSIAVHLQDAKNLYQEYVFKNGEKAWHTNCDFARKINGIPDFTDPDVCPVLYREES